MGKLVNISPFCSSHFLLFFSNFFIQTRRNSNSPTPPRTSTSPPAGYACVGGKVVEGGEQYGDKTEEVNKGFVLLYKLLAQ